MDSCLLKTSTKMSRNKNYSANPCICRCIHIYTQIRLFFLYKDCTLALFCYLKPLGVLRREEMVCNQTLVILTLI